MELFTWFRMHGADAQEHMTVVPLIHSQLDATPSSRSRELPADLRELLTAFAAFRAHKAQCFKPADRQHLLGVIESGARRPAAHLDRTRAAAS